MKTAYRGVVPILVCVFFAACAKSGDPARECLDALVKAAHDRDASAFFNRVAADFQAADGSSRADAEGLVRQYFAGYEILDVTVSDVTIEKAENAARVRFRADLSGQPRKIGGLDGLLPRTSSYDFDMRLVPEAGKWKVAWASWQPRS
ncbi:MAG TPA: hypothetical protein VJA66_14995 [Thermoanaerobaculia bacterium]